MVSWKGGKLGSWEVGKVVSWYSRILRNRKRRCGAGPFLCL